MTAWRQRAFPVLALLGILGSVAALALDAHAALAAWLAAAVAASAVPIGALVILLSTYLMPRAWTDEMHIPLASATLAMPAAALLFVPVLAGMAWLYPWTHVRPEHAFQAVYLTPWTFLIRTILYFAIWTGLALWARRAWADQSRMARVASVGLIVYALTASLAGIDWIESLNPEFHSSIYGLLFLTFQLLAGMSFGVAAVAIMRPGSSALSGYGALLLSVMLLWAYMHAMQYIIIWAGNIPAEIQWYLRRLTGGWAFVLWGLMFLQFIIPFFAMLRASVRGGPGPLLVIAGGTLALRFVESYLLVLPAADARPAVLWLALPAATAATVGILGMAMRFTWALVAHAPRDRQQSLAAETA